MLNTIALVAAMSATSGLFGGHCGGGGGGRLMHHGRAMSSCGSSMGYSAPTMSGGCGSSMPMMSGGCGSSMAGGVMPTSQATAGYPMAAGKGMPVASPNSGMMMYPSASPSSVAPADAVPPAPSIPAPPVSAPAPPAPPAPSSSPSTF